MSPKYIVTGAAGFIGTHLCEALLESGALVVGLDNFTSESSMFSRIKGSRFTLVRTDIVDNLREAEWPTDFRNGHVDGVFHLACPASPKDYTAHPLATLRAGSIGTDRVLQVGRRLGARVVLASTSEVYGSPSVHPQREDYWGCVNPIGPRSMYDEAKRYAEALTFAYMRETEVDFSVVRIFNTFGPGMRPLDGRLVPTFLHQAIQGKDLTIHGDGSQTRSLCYVSDTIAALLSMMSSPGISGPINVGNPTERSVLDIAEAILSVTRSRSRIVYEPRPTDDPDRRRPSIELARELLNWSPQVSLERGLELTLDSLRPRAK